MKYFIVENNQPAGPFEIEELVRKGIKADDLVWCEGMEQWTSASNISEIMAALNRCPGIPPVMPLNMNQPPVYKTEQEPAAPEQVVSTMPAMPNTWLVASIIVTLFCCAPFGIAAIVYAARVETLWQTGRYEDAEKTSGKAKNGRLIAFLSGFAFYALYLVSMFTVFSNLKF